MRHRLSGSVLILAAAVLLAGCTESDRDRKRSSKHAGNTVSIHSSVLDDHWKSYATHVPRGTTRLEIRLHRLSQDADLFVAGPRDYDTCDSVERGTRADTCVFYNPTPGEWLIDVIGWDYGRTHYTLTTTLSPSYKEASLWQIDAGALRLQSTPLSAGTVHSELEDAQTLLPVLLAAVETARTLESGNHHFTLRRNADAIGQADLMVERMGDGRAVLHIKAVRRDAEGQRRLIYTRAGHPLVLDEHGETVRQGIVSLHLDHRPVALRLGSDTGTGAELQLVAEPGPAVQELRWGDVGDRGLQLESR
ncbi:MAG: PPC domain-containing protein [Ectothiorhodospiraceae bacterium]|nr:PPC domain-containing protein [Ectothiorhodospiraceae bacterium]